MKSNTALKRVIAYLIDFLVITLISSAITYMSFINPTKDKYDYYSEKYQSVLNDYYDKEITVEEFNDQASSLSYNVNKYGAIFIGCDIIVIMLYFGVFVTITKGQTLGKKIMNIKIVAKDGTNPKFYKYFIRAFILNGVIMDVVALISVCFTKNVYAKIYSTGSNLNMALMMTSFLMIMFSASERGIHDYLAGTKVIDLKKSKDVPEAEIKEKESKEEIQEEVKKLPVKEIKNKNEDKESKSPKTKTTSSKNKAKNKK